MKERYKNYLRHYNGRIFTEIMDDEDDEQELPMTYVEFKETFYDEHEQEYRDGEM